MDAYASKPTPDTRMPMFEGKVDPGNLLNDHQSDFLKVSELSLHKLSFMGTEWLGMRLLSDNKDRCLRFCLCAAALQNLGRKMSQSIVVNARNDGGESHGFTATPLGSSSEKALATFYERSESISELSTILINAAGLPEKKLAGELKKWCELKSAQYGDERRSSMTSLKDVSRALGSFLEDKFAGLLSEDRGRRRSIGGVKPSGTTSVDEARAAVDIQRRRRRSAPSQNSENARTGRKSSRRMSRCHSEPKSHSEQGFSPVVLGAPGTESGSPPSDRRRGRNRHPSRCSSGEMQMSVMPSLEEDRETHVGIGRVATFSTLSTAQLEELISPKRPARQRRNSF